MYILCLPLRWTELICIQNLDYYGFHNTEWRLNMIDSSLPIPDSLIVDDESIDFAYGTLFRELRINLL